MNLMKPLSSPQAIWLGPADAARYARLRLQMLTHAPSAFSADPGDDMALAASRITALENGRPGGFAVEVPSSVDAPGRFGVLHYHFEVKDSLCRG